MAFLPLSSNYKRVGVERKILHPLPCTWFLIFADRGGESFSIQRETWGDRLLSLLTPVFLIYKSTLPGQDG